MAGQGFKSGDKVWVLSKTDNVILAVEDVIKSISQNGVGLTTNTDTFSSFGWRNSAQTNDAGKEASSDSDYEDDDRVEIVPAPPDLDTYRSQSAFGKRGIVSVQINQTRRVQLRIERRKNRNG